MSCFLNTSDRICVRKLDYYFSGRVVYIGFVKGPHKLVSYMAECFVAVY